MHLVRRGLEDHLQLQVASQAERVFAVAGVGRTPRRLHVGHPVGLGAEDPQKALRMHRARTNLQIVRLLDDAAAIGPIALEIEDQRLQVHRASGACHTSGKYTTAAGLREYFPKTTRHRPTRPPARFRISDFGFRISDFGFPTHTPTDRKRPSAGSARGNEPRAAERAIFNIVGSITLNAGWVSRANNVEGGNSREARSEKRVHSNARERCDGPR